MNWDVFATRFAVYSRNKISASVEEKRGAREHVMLCDVMRRQARILDRMKTTRVPFSPRALAVEEDSREMKSRGNMKLYALVKGNVGKQPPSSYNGYSA